MDGTKVEVRGGRAGCPSASLSSSPSGRDEEAERPSSPPTASDSAARMNPLMTTFIQIRLIVIMVNN